MVPSILSQCQVENEDDRKQMAGFKSFSTMHPKDVDVLTCNAVWNMIRLFLLEAV